MRLPIIPYNPKLKERARELRKKMTLAETLTPVSSASPLPARYQPSPFQGGAWMPVPE